MKPLTLLFLAGAAHAAGPIQAGFPEALERIVQRSPSVLRQREVLEGTRSKNLSKGALLWVPSLSGQAKAGGEWADSITTSKRSVEGVAELNLFRFGADLATSRAANREIDTETYRLDQAIFAAESEGVTSLVAYIQSYRQKEVNEQILGSRKDSLEVARRRYQRGQLALEEVEKVSVDLDNARAQLRDAETDLVQAAAELERLLGEPSIAPEWPWKDSLPKGAASLLKTTSADLSTRPDWKSAQASLQAAEQRAKEAFGEMLPRLDARASVGYFQSRVLGVESKGPAWTAGLALTIPLFDRLAGYGRYQAQVHAEAAAEADWTQVKRVAKRDFDSARATLNISLDTALAREKTLATARKLYQANQERFNRGVLSANDFRIDQDRLYQTELFVLRGWAAVHNDFRRLCHAIGKRVESCMASGTRRR